MKGSLKPTTAGPSISHSHRNHRVFGKLFYTFDLYSGNMGCWRSNRLVIATNYDTHLIPVLFEIRDWMISYIFFLSFPFLSLRYLPSQSL